MMAIRVMLGFMSGVAGYYALLLFRAASDERKVMRAARRRGEHVNGSYYGVQVNLRRGGFAFVKALALGSILVWQGQPPAAVLYTIVVILSAVQSAADWYDRDMYAQIVNDDVAEEREEP